MVLVIACWCFAAVLCVSLLGLLVSGGWRFGFAIVLLLCCVGWLLVLWVCHRFPMFGGALLLVWFGVVLVFGNSVGFGFVYWFGFWAVFGD